MKTREEIKLNAKKSLSGKVFLSFVIMIIPALISGLPSILSTRFEDSGEGVRVVFSLLIIIFSIGLMPMQTGLRLYFLNLYRGQKEEFNDLFVPYKNKSAFEIIKAKVLSGIYIIIGFIFLIIPGIYLALKYSMIDYIIADKKNIKYNEAMKESGEIMQGNKGRLIVLALSFIGWFFIVLITFGIAIIYVGPYLETTFAGFYDDIKKPVEIEPLPEKQF
ncbi:MAG: DUF975 family protein [Bacillota bacterium]